MENLRDVVKAYEYCQEGCSKDCPYYDEIHCLDILDRNVYCALQEYLELSISNQAEAKQQQNGNGG